MVPAEKMAALDVSAPPVNPQLEDSFKTLLDPTRRADPSQRQAAREQFREQRALQPELYEVATAGMLFLSKSDKEWNLQGANLAALEEYFAKPWLKDRQKLTPAAHQEAADWLAKKIAALKKTDAKASTDTLALFGIGHLGHAPPGPQTDTNASLLGLVVHNGIAGTAEGHVIRDLNSWISTGDFDLAVLAFVKEHRATDTPSVRFVWAWAMLQQVLVKKRGYDRPIAALKGIKAAEVAFRDHLDALANSVQSVAVCNVCSGEARFRCTNCHGQQETKHVCKHCKGTGRKIQANGFRLDNCPRCKNTGIELTVRCEKCDKGYSDCRQCKEPQPPPALDDVCAAQPCETCDGRGFVFRKILWACPSCMGLGVKLTPKAEPAKVLK
jgi:hypothetical protein